MENNKIKVSVLVAGQRFNLLTDKSEKYVRDLASDVDARINSLSVSGEMTRERAAVLTALDFADDGMNERDNLNAVKEQIKDYLREIERLRDNNAKLIGDYNKLKDEYERLVADNRTVAEMEKEVEKDKALIENMKTEISGLRGQIAELKQSSVKYESEAIEEREAPPEREEEVVITADDDLFFDEEEEPVKPLPQKKKNRHEHKHENPYKKNAEKKKEQKGYTQQRQYTFFDINED